MHKARAFFFICAGLFLLALAYHLGARSAKAQAGSCIVAGSIAPYRYSVVSWHVVAANSSRMVYYNGAVVGGGPVPGSSPIVAVGADEQGDIPGGSSVGVILDDGSFYGETPDNPSWQYISNTQAGCAPTPAQGISIGQLKAKYATPAPAKVTR